MIEQTEMVVKEWIYVPSELSTMGQLMPICHTSLDVMKKRAPTKKGIACRLTSKFTVGEAVILLYVAENTYVIDLEDIIDRNELLKMIRFSFFQFNEKFELRKLGTDLQNSYLAPLDENRINLDAILPLLI